jgi:hypothetical protein
MFFALRRSSLLSQFYVIEKWQIFDLYHQIHFSLSQSWNKVSLLLLSLVSLLGLFFQSQLTFGLVEDKKGYLPKSSVRAWLPSMSKSLFVNKLQLSPNQATLLTRLSEASSLLLGFNGHSPSAFYRRPFFSLGKTLQADSLSRTSSLIRNSCQIKSSQVYSKLQNDPKSYRSYGKSTKCKSRNLDCKGLLLTNPNNTKLY